MYIVDRSLQFVRGFLLSYGPTSIKKHFWDKEYTEEKWAFAYNTVGDCVYQHLEKYSTNGDVLDIGCGSGNTATEMADNYRSYLGVDISEAALAKARRRSQECGRGEKNKFECGDFLTYVPTGKYDVILFRESMYHVPLGKVKATLDRYSAYLKEGGVFVVRLFASSGGEEDKDKSRPIAMLNIMATEFDVLEKRQYEERGRPTVIVFRPKAAVRN
jgi:SAM-dependent methyltransferase